MDNTQIGKRLNTYVPKLDVSFEDLQKQLAAFIQSEREQLKACILAGESGFGACGIHTQVWDVVIQKVYEVAAFQIRDEYQKQIDVLQELPDIDTTDLEAELEGWVPDVALYGVGSYGRNELCYFSDVDVVYTSSVDLEDIYDESTLELIRWFYDFFDSLHSVIPGFEFSFIYRPLADIAQWNYQDMTALIDMRFIAGDATLTERFRKAVHSEKSDISLVLDLLKSKADAFKASEETIYLNQPNVKTGRGGLRTLQYALWICGLPDFTSIPELYGRYDDAQLMPSLDFMFKVRNLLHVLADAPHDDLTYHPEKEDMLQAQIARVLELTDETDEGRYAFMAEYYAKAKYLHFKAELLIRKMLANGIPISDVLAVRTDMLYCIDNNFGELDANELFTLFTYFQQYDFEIDASLSTFISRYVHAFDWRSFRGRMAELMNVPGDVAKTLTRLHRLDILSHLGEGGALFEKAMMTRSERSLDPYTVGKHTLVAIGYLDEIRQTESSSPFGGAGGFGSPVSPAPTSELEELNTAFRALSDPSPLYMALFLHDIDKPDPSHPITGAEKAERIAPEFGFNSQQTDEICFLIREHLTMIDLARYHHWDESTLAEFCKKVNSLERLTALYLLTYCDSKANGSQNFSHVVKHNLKSLYEVARTRFVGQEETQWGAFAPVEEFQQFLHHMPVSYRISVSPEEIAMHIKMATQAEAASTKTETTSITGIVQFVDRPGFTELHLCSPSRIGKLHTVSGLFFANGIDVRDARVYTKQDTNIELEIYRLVHQPLHHRGEPMPLDEDLKRDLDFDIRSLLAEEVTLEQVFEKHYVNLNDTWQVDDVTVETARSYSEIVVVGEEKMGFLHYFSGILAKLGLNVEMCKCSGLGGQAIDRFYVQPVVDPKAVHADIMAALAAENGE